VADMTRTLDRYAAEYENARRTKPQRDPAWLARTRDDAMARFLSLGFPTTRDEEWRFTSVAPIAESAFVLPHRRAVDIDIGPFTLPGTIPALVFVNGWYEPALSRVGALPSGVLVESLTSSLSRPGDLEAHLTRLASFDGHAFTALNTALFADGAHVRIPARTIVQAPIHVLFVSTHDEDAATMSHPRVVAVLGNESQATIVETYASVNGAGYFANPVTEILVGENATLDHYRLQYESEQAYHVGTIHIRARRDASVTSHSISLGGLLVRNEVVAALDGEGAQCTLNGLYLADGQRHVDNHTTIDHAQPHCGSREVYKGILADRARGVFNGKIIVRPDAQKTDAKQTNRALLLSEDAQINTKPQLEIFANDVKCTHGAAVGQLDEEAIFYLRSRGLGELEARHVLVHAFMAEVLRHMRSQSIGAAIEEVLVRRLSRALPVAA
jgi:Fe-S cluster assembly protein SufD